MKRFLLALIFAASCAALAAAQTEDDYDREVIISEINSLSAPYVRGDYIVFTGPARSRHVGIAFDFEQFRVIHSFERIDTKDVDNKVIGSLYFYTLRIPENIDAVAYKIIADGLWSVDPLNPSQVYDSLTGSMLSVVRISRDPTPVTRVVKKGVVRFVYRGKAGQKIQLSGTFTNWDPFIYDMTETSPGLYERELYLLPGTHYYNYYTGFTPLADTGNPERGFTEDGRSASAITVF